MGDVQYLRSLLTAHPDFAKKVRRVLAGSQAYMGCPLSKVVTHVDHCAGNSFPGYLPHLAGSSRIRDVNYAFRAPFDLYDYHEDNDEED